MKGCLIFSTFIFEYRQIWLNILIYGRLSLQQFHPFFGLSCPTQYCVPLGRGLLIVDNALCTRLLLQLIFLGLPSAQFSFTKLSCFAPISSPCQRAPQGARNMQGSMCKGSLKHVTYPLARPKMPKACMIWTQNMTRNPEAKQNGAKGRQEKNLQQFSCIDRLH